MERTALQLGRARKILSLHKCLFCARLGMEMRISHTALLAERNPVCPRHPDQRWLCCDLHVGEAEHGAEPKGLLHVDRAEVSTVVQPKCPGSTK